MSGTNTTIFEELYSFGQAATVSVPTASAVTITAGTPPIEIPGGYFNKLGKLTSSLHLRLGGLLTATAAVPTWSFGLAYTQVTPAVFSASTILCTASTAITPTAGTNAQFWMEAHINLRTLAAGAATTLYTQGFVKCPALFPSPFEQSLPPTGTGNTNAAYDTEVLGFLWPYLTLSAATATNTVTVEWIKMYGEN